MAELDALCDLLDEEIKEDPEDEDPDEAELKAMMEKVQAMKAKLAQKKKKVTEVDLFASSSTSQCESKSPVKTNPFIEKPSKPIQLHSKTPDFGPSLPVKTSRIITGFEKEELLSRISKAESIVRKDLADSSDEEAESNSTESTYNAFGREIKQNLKQRDNKIGFNQVTGSSLNLTKSSSNTKLPQDLYVEKRTKIRIANPLITQTQLDLNLVNRSLIPLYRLKDAIAKKETDNVDWATIGILYYKSSQTSKNGNAYTIWKMTDLFGSQDPISVSVMLFGRAHAVHYKIPMNKVVGLLNAKILDDRSGRGDLTLSVDHPDKVLEMGDSIDAGKCKAIKADGSGCTNLVNLAACEYCHYHVKKAYQSLSSKRGDIQSSYSGGGGDARSRIMAKIAPKGEVFGGGQILNSTPGKGPTLTKKNVARSNSKLRAKDTKALQSLGVVTVPPSQTRNNKSEKETTEKLVSKADSLSHMSLKEKEVVKRVLKEGINQDLGLRLLEPTPGSKALLKHMTVDVEKKEQERVIPKSAKTLLMEHKEKILQEEKVKKIIEARKRVALTNMNSVPQLGKGLEGGFIDFSPMSSSKAKAIQALQGKTLPKSNPNSVKRKRLSQGESESSRKRIAHSVNPEPESRTTTEDTTLKGLNGKILRAEELERLKKLKSINPNLAEEHEVEEREKYFDVLEKKDAMEEKMVNTKELETKAVTCAVCNYTAYAQSDLCKDQGHRVKVIRTKKRFFECSNCKKRVTSLNKYPTSSCGNCGGSSWKRCGMMKERKAVLEHEKLLIRGVEQKFIGAHASKLDLNSSY